MCVFVYVGGGGACVRIYFCAHVCFRACMWARAVSYFTEKKVICQLNVRALIRKPMICSKNLIKYIKISSAEIPIRK